MDDATAPAPLAFCQGAGRPVVRMTQSFRDIHFDLAPEVRFGCDLRVHEAHPEVISAIDGDFRFF